MFFGSERMYIVRFQLAPTTVPTLPENPPRIPFLMCPMIVIFLGIKHFFYYWTSIGRVLDEYWTRCARFLSFFVVRCFSLSWCKVTGKIGLLLVVTTGGRFVGAY